MIRRPTLGAPALATIVLSCFSLCLQISPVSAKIALPKWFGDHMVLQTIDDNGVDALINGKSEPNERVEVTVTTPGKEYKFSGKADSEGDWQIRLDKMQPNDQQGECSITVAGSDNEVVANHVRFGDVFFCSGQSNMVYPLRLSFDPEAEAATLKQYPNFHFFVSERDYSDHPKWNLPSKGDCDIDGHLDGSHSCNRWITQEEAMEDIPGEKFTFIMQFSAVCFMTARDIAKMNSNIGSTRPIGLIQVGWKGSRVEAWMSKEAVENTGPMASKVINRPMKNQTSVLYNAMVHPWNKYAVRAVLWYQGEANAQQAVEGLLDADDTEYYTAMYQSMIADWRAKKAIGDFAWGTVQLPPSVASDTDPNEQLQTKRMEIRIAQAATAVGNDRIKNSAMAVTLDLGGSGNWHYNHPPNKNEISRRLALGILHVAYHKQTKQLWTGPVFLGAKKEDSKVVLEFSETGSGMNLRDVKAANVKGGTNDCTKCCSQAPPFEVQIGNEWRTVPRDSISFQDKSVILDLSTLTRDPVANVRYAWSDYVDCVLENSENLVASPFVHSFETSESTANARMGKNLLRR